MRYRGLRSWMRAYEGPAPTAEAGTLRTDDGSPHDDGLPARRSDRATPDRPRGHAPGSELHPAVHLAPRRVHRHGDPRVGGGRGVAPPPEGAARHRDPAARPQARDLDRAP